MSESHYGGRVITGGTLHEAFQREVQKLLDTTDMSEEDRQRILTGMVCPCCGGGASVVVPLKRDA